MTVWFAGCHHFNHARMIELARRPFQTVEQMNETLVANHNSVVKKGDHVYLLGDLCWETEPGERDADPEPWLERLNGTKTLIWGNHDDRSLVPSTDHCIECLDYLEEKIDGVNLVLFHYPIEDWNGRYRGWIHLHAHDHLPVFRNPNVPTQSQSGLELGPPRGYPPSLLCNRFRVGVDACRFRPVSLEEVRAASRTTVG